MSLQDDALRLVELDQEVVRAVVEGKREAFGAALGAYMELRKSLKIRLLDESAASVANAEATEVLRKIGGGEGLASDKVIERLAALSGEDISLEFDNAELEELGSELFYSWYSHYEYVTGLAELRPLILRGAAPESVTRLVRQVKDCYAFQQYDAAFGLCRTLLEASIRDICERCGLFPDLGENVVLYEKYNWGQLRDKVSSGSLRERLRDLYGRLCEVMHARKTATRKEAREGLCQTNWASAG